MHHEEGEGERDRELDDARRQRKSEGSVRDATNVAQGTFPQDFQDEYPARVGNCVG